MRIPWKRVIGLTLVLALAFGQVSLAFDDATGEESDSAILKLKEKGVVHGDGKSFDGDRALTLAEGLAMIARGLLLSSGPDESGDAPTVGDLFERVADGAWYADSFRAAALAGLDVPRDADPVQMVSREQFLHLLLQALQATGDYPFAKRLFYIADGDNINPAYAHSIQLMMNGGFVKPDAEGRLYPRETITRREAAVTLLAVMEFVERHAEEGGTMVNEEVSYTVEPLNDEVAKVILSRGEKPNSGYRIEIAAIVFIGERTAEIQYRLRDPEPGHMYLQVITYPTATAYVPADHEVVLKQMD